LGRNADALRVSKQAADLIPIEKDALAGPTFQNGLAQIEARAGAPEDAIKRLRHLLSIPGGQVSIARLKIDPSYKTVAAVAKSNPLSKKPIIKLRDLEPIFFIGMSERGYPGYRHWLTTTCQEVGFTPKVLQDADIEQAVIQAVAAGLGVALLPDQVKK